MQVVFRQYDQPLSASERCHFCAWLHFVVGFHAACMAVAGYLPVKLAAKTIHGYLASPPISALASAAAVSPAFEVEQVQLCLHRPLEAVQHDPAA
jgi:hypothetical protein